MAKKVMAKKVLPSQAEGSKLFLLLLTRIRECEASNEQWRTEPWIPGWADCAVQYLHHLEALVELLEVFDCGSTGGFGKNQPNSRDLHQRADWLLKKYAHFAPKTDR